MSRFGPLGLRMALLSRNLPWEWEHGRSASPYSPRPRHVVERPNDLNAYQPLVTISNLSLPHGGRGVDASELDTTSS